MRITKMRILENNFKTVLLKMVNITRYLLFALEYKKMHTFIIFVY